MPYVKGFLNIVAGGQPDNELPGNQPGIDNSLPSLGVGIDNTLPAPPPGVWPPPTLGNPIVPVPPIANVPPGTIWPSPGAPNRPDNTLPGGRPARPDNTLPNAPARPDNTLPGTGGQPDNSLPSGTFWVVAGIPGMGWRYIAVDPSLTVGHPLPNPTPPTAGTPIPPAPQPKA